MARVVLGARRLAGRPVEPVVERAEADQEPQRRDQQREQQDRVLRLGRRARRPSNDRVAVGLPHDDDDRRAEQRAEDEEEHRPRESGCAQSSRHQPPLVTSERYFTSASSLAGAQRLLEVRRHDPVLIAVGDLRARVDDRLLDERLVLALEHLVEVRADRAVRARVGERVAGAAVGLGGREDRLAVRGRPPPPPPPPPPPAAAAGLPSVGRARRRTSRAGPRSRSSASPRARGRTARRRRSGRRRAGSGVTRVGDVDARAPRPSSCGRPGPRSRAARPWTGA